MTAPSRSEQRRRTEQVLVRMDKNELAVCDAMAAQYGMSRADVLRSALMFAGIAETAAADSRTGKC